MSLVPYEIDSDDELANHPSKGFQKDKKLKSPVKIVLEKLSTFGDEDDLRSEAKVGRKSNIRKDLFSILPPPKSKRTNLILPRVLRTTTALTFQDNSGELREKKTRTICKRPANVPKCSGARRDVVNDILEGAFCWANGVVVNCAPDVRDPGLLRNSDFRKLLNDEIGRVRTDVQAELCEERDRVKAITDPEHLEKPLLEQVNRTCKKKNHISYLLQMAKTNEQDLKNKWSANKYTRQQTKAKYGF